MNVHPLGERKTWHLIHVGKGNGSWLINIPTLLRSPWKFRQTAGKNTCFIIFCWNCPHSFGNENRLVTGKQQKPRLGQATCAKEHSQWLQRLSPCQRVSSGTVRFFNTVIWWSHSRAIQGLFIVKRHEGVVDKLIPIRNDDPGVLSRIPPHPAQFSIVFVSHSSRRGWSMMLQSAQQVTFHDGPLCYHKPFI